MHTHTCGCVGVHTQGEDANVHATTCARKHSAAWTDATGGDSHQLAGTSPNFDIIIVRCFRCCGLSLSRGAGALLPSSDASSSSSWASSSTNPPAPLPFAGGRRSSRSTDAGVAEPLPE